MSNHSFVQTQRATKAATRHKPQGHGYGKDILACLWPKRGDNIGSLARTSMALGMELALPKGELAKHSLKRGCTMGVTNVDVLWLPTDPISWISYKRSEGYWVIGVEQTSNSTPIRQFHRSKKRNLILVGNESTGVPQQALDLCDQVVEIPMNGTGSSLNVACAGTIVAYKVTGLV